MAPKRYDGKKRGRIGEPLKIATIDLLGEPIEGKDLGGERFLKVRWNFGFGSKEAQGENRRRVLRTCLRELGRSTDCEFWRGTPAGRRYTQRRTHGGRSGGATAVAAQPGILDVSGDGAGARRIHPRGNGLKSAKPAGRSVLPCGERRHAFCTGPDFRFARPTARS